MSGENWGMESMRRRQLTRAVSIAGLAVCAMATLASSSGAATPSRYILRHPKRAHCKRHYTRKVVRVKKRIHGHTRKVRETICVRVRRKPAASALGPQPTTPASIPAPDPFSTPLPAPAPRREPRLREPRPAREAKLVDATCTSTFTGAEGNAWGTAANWTEAIIPSGPSSYACISSEYPSTVAFSANSETPTEIGGVSAENAEGIALQSGKLTLADPEQESLINNVKPGGAAVTLGEGVLLGLTGATGELGASEWSGPGTLEVPRAAFLRTGVCAEWSGGKENRCVDGTPTLGYGGLQVKNFGTIWGAGISLCRNGAAQPAKLENEGVLRIILSGSFDDAPECGEAGAVVNGERGLIALAQLDGYGCNVRVGMASLQNKGLVKLSSCLKPETEEVQRPELEIGSSLSEAGTIIDAGIVQIQGDYAPTSASNLTVSIRQTFPAGSPETNYGAVKVAGSATLAGELNIETDRLKGRPPILGETFQTLDVGEVGGSLSGEFTLGNHCIPAEPGNGYKVDYKSGDKGTVTLEVAEVAGC